MALKRLRKAEVVLIYNFTDDKGAGPEFGG